MIKVGTRVQFVPHYMKEDKQNKNYALRPQPVAGRVFKVNENGVIFVEYIVRGVTLRMGFLLFDIGRKLKILK